MIQHALIAWLTFLSCEGVVINPSYSDAAIEMPCKNMPHRYVYIRPVKDRKCATGRQLREIGIVVQPKSLVAFMRPNGAILPAKQCLSFDDPKRALT